MKTKPIIISEEEKAELQKISRSPKTENRIATRARLILHCTEEKTYDEIVKITGHSRASIAKWRLRYIEYGLDGLNDLARSGKPRVIPPEKFALVIEKACQKPQDGYSKWSQRRIARK